MNLKLRFGVLNSQHNFNTLWFCITVSNVLVTYNDIKKNILINGDRLNRGHSSKLYFVNTSRVANDDED